MSASYNEDELKFVHHVNLGASILSFFGSIWMIVFCLKTPTPRTVSLQIILALAISDFVYSISNFMSEFRDLEDNRLFCQVEGYIRHASFVSSIYWCTCTAILCANTCVYANTFNQERFFRKAVIISLLICLIIFLIPVILDTMSYQKALLFCWLTYTPDLVTNETVRILIRVFLEHVTIGTALLISIVGYTKAIRRINSLPEYYIAHIDVKVYKLLWYPVIMFLTFLPSMINNLYQTLTHQVTATPVLAFHVGITHAIGFTNALVYGFQRRSSRKQSQETRVSFSGSETDSEAADYTHDLIKAEAQF